MNLIQVEDYVNDLAKRDIPQVTNNLREITNRVIDDISDRTNLAEDEVRTEFNTAVDDLDYTFAVVLSLSEPRRWRGMRAAWWRDDQDEVHPLNIISEEEGRQAYDDNDTDEPEAIAVELAASQLLIFPLPDDVYAVNVVWHRAFTPLSANTDGCYLLDHYPLVVADGVASEVFKITEEYEKAIGFKTAFEAGVAEIRRKERRRQTRPRTLTPVLGSRRRGTVKSAYSRENWDW